MGVRQLFVLHLLVAGIALQACGGVLPGLGEDDDVPKAEWPIELPDPPDPGIVIETPWFTIPSGTELMFCTFGTFPEDIGVHWYEWFHHPIYGHHMRMNKVDGADPAEFPDGEAFDCIDPTFYRGVGRQGNLFAANGPGAIIGRMQLENGWGVAVEAGQRYMIQSHFINVTDEDIQVQDIIHIGSMPLENVEVPLSTWAFSAFNSIEVPPNTLGAVTNTCAFSEPVNIYMVNLHMHEWGDSFESYFVDGEGGREPFYMLPYWLDEWRFQRPSDFFEPALPVAQGQDLEFTCNFLNDLDEPLTWPTEMCVVEGLAYPLYQSVNCVDGEVIH